jgi:hypothetical protein
MQLAPRLSLPVTLAALALTAATALAAIKPAPVVEPIDQGAAITSVKLGTTSVLATCTLGVTGTPYYLVNYLLPPNDAYYTFIDPASCSACGSGIVNALTAHAYLNFRAVCTQPVSVGIYGAIGDPGCYAPDESNPLCAPFNVTLSPAAAGNYNFSIPIPGGCCISQPAFLKIEFTSTAAGCATSTTIPRLITTASCDLACTSWNVYPGGGPDDLCVDIALAGNPIMNVEVDCCASTPTHNRSWGTLKSSYR